LGGNHTGMYDAPDGTACATADRPDHDAMGGVDRGCVRGASCRRRLRPGGDDVHTGLLVATLWPRSASGPLSRRVRSPDHFDSHGLAERENLSPACFGTERFVANALVGHALG